MTTMPSNTRYVVVGMTYSREQAEEHLSSVKGALIGAEIVELEDGDALVRASDARRAIEILAARRMGDWAVAPSSNDDAHRPSIHQRLSAIAESDAAFMKIWERLADEGACDAPGGAEQRRVKDEWYAAGKPEIEPFIRERANVGPR